jgi:hypothetical protein
MRVVSRSTAFRLVSSAVLAALVLALTIVRAQYGSQIGCMTNDCNSALKSLLKEYEYAVESINGCDSSCQLECYEMLEEALKAKDSFSCPSVETVSMCMALRHDAWVAFLKECPLLKVASSEAESDAEAEAEAPGPAEAEAESDAEAEAEAPGAEEAEAESDAEAEAEAPGAEEAEAESEAEAEAPVADGEAAATSRRLRQVDGEAEAPGGEEAAGEAEAEAPGSEEAEAEAPESEEAEAEAEAPESEEAEAEAAAPGSEEAEAEAEGASSSLAAAAPSSGDAEAEGECSSAAAEAESESDGLGCWPDFENYDDVEKYIEGAYYSSVFSAPKNTVGIILSVFFWVGLTGMGVWLGRTKH